MSAFENNDSAIAGIVFLVVFLVYILFAGNVVRQVGIKTRFTMLAIYGVLKFAGQICGIVLAAVGMAHWNWLIAYLVLSVVGFFMLVLTLFQFVAKAQLEAHGSSWLNPVQNDTVKDDKANLLLKFGPAKLVRLVMMVGNILNIYGTASIAGEDPSSLPASTIHSAKIYRTVGSSIFLAATVLSIALAVYVRFVENVRRSVLINCVFLAAPFMFVRSLFGVLSIYVKSMNYFNTQNYTSAGMNRDIVIYEYVLGTLMEFISALIYILSFYWSKQRESAVQHVEQFHIESEKDRYHL